LNQRKADRVIQPKKGLPLGSVRRCPIAMVVSKFVSQIPNIARDWFSLRLMKARKDLKLERGRC